MNSIKILKSWFKKNGWKPFRFQMEVWEKYLEGYSGLIHSATGTGKTYAAFFGSVLEYLNNPKKKSGLKLIWITPIKSLANDIYTNLKKPIDDLKLDWNIEIRTGDVTSSVKLKQIKNLPDVLITTPESLTLMLTHKNSDEYFKNLNCLVIDEWHELISSKRGVQTELLIARIKNKNPKVRFWGISATIGNLDYALNSLTYGLEKKIIINGEIQKKIIVDSVIPDDITLIPWAGHLGIRLINQVIAEIENYKSVIVFTNTRSQTEFWYQSILHHRPEWAGIISLHHGSLDKEVREFVENGLKLGKLKCVVSTSSLDLGVDFTSVERVIQIGSPKGVARLLQRAGRSGHNPDGISRITCVPTNALELIEFDAVRYAINRKYIEDRQTVKKPLDVLIQHLVTIALGDGFDKKELYKEVINSESYKDLTFEEFEWALNFVTNEKGTLKAYSEYSKVILDEDRYKVLDKRISRFHRMSIGTIVSDTAMSVQFVSGGRLGSVEESFISRVKPGSVFVFAGRLLELVRIRDMTVYVKKATKKNSNIPRWDGGRMPLSTELSKMIRLKLEYISKGIIESDELRCILPIINFQEKYSIIPKQNELLIEKIKSEDGYHIFIYPFEGRLVHEGLSALAGYRISKITPITFTMACNDYGFDLLSDKEIPIETAIKSGLFNTENLFEDIMASLNMSEMAKRQFREIARISGLVFQGYPGSKKSIRQIQASSSLLFDIFNKYDPENLLLYQARKEVLEKQLEESRIYSTLQRINNCEIKIIETDRFTPLSFPILADIMRDKMSSEKIEDRIMKMQLDLE
ncbi:MAG TPA: ligase-associated DNA damage response DEXH box helicase [Ignavibacteria bacterium]|nr:ligase-associated DNA damage response DEXH box helicase [Ignavibacteria bacterium]